MGNNFIKSFSMELIEMIYQYQKAMNATKGIANMNLDAIKLSICEFHLNILS